MLWMFLRHLDRTQIEPEVGFLSPGAFVDEVTKLGISTWSMHASRLRNPFGYIRTVTGLAARLRNERPDAVLAWSAKAHVYLGAAALVARSRSRVLWWQHGITTGHWLDRLATLVPADGIGCSSHACEAAQTRLAPRRRTFVAYPGVELAQAACPITRDELGIDTGAFVVGIVGRLQPWKGQSKVIHAVAELRRRRVPAVALIVGGSAFGLSLGYASELNDLSQHLGVAKWVVFTGQVPEAGPYYPLMDVVVNASTREPFGIAIVEAMAAGRPVVAFADGGPAEIIENGVGGVLVPEDGLVAALAAFEADPVFAASVGSKGRERVRATFGAKAATTAFVRSMLEICDVHQTSVS